MNKFDTGTFKLDTSGLRDKDPDNFIPVPPSWFEFQRGDIKKKQGLRLRIRNNTGLKTPDGKRHLNVGDIFDKKTSVYVKYGAQFTDYITMGVAGVAISDVKPADAVPCPCEAVKETNGLSAFVASVTDSVSGAAKIGSVRKIGRSI
jgi:hypothetical protein